MNDETPPPIDTRAAWMSALQWGFRQAIAGGARRITVVDPDFADWPLDDPALHVLWTGWLKLPQRKLVLLASSYDDVPRRHPRFVAWRALWSHAVDCWSPADGPAVDLPTLLVDDTSTGVVLFDRIHWRGRAGNDARSARQLRERCDALLQRSEAAFAVIRLGL